MGLKNELMRGVSGRAEFDSVDGAGVSERVPKVSRKWRHMAEIYKRFASGYADADFGEDAALAMYLHESTGAPLPDPRKNGYALGKKWMDITVAGWKEEIPQLGLLVSELRADGYPDWFLERVGVLHLVPTVRKCMWWAGREMLNRALDRNYAHDDDDMPVPAG